MLCNLKEMLQVHILPHSNTYRGGQLNTQLNFPGNSYLGGLIKGPGILLQLFRLSSHFLLQLHTPALGDLDSNFYTDVVGHHFAKWAHYMMESEVLMTVKFSPSLDDVGS